MFDREDGRQLLIGIKSALDEAGVPFFLIQGTALGAYRDRDFVPNERDIDLGVLIEHFLAEEVCKQLLERNIAVETRFRHDESGMCHTVVAYGKASKADIVGFYRHEDKRYARTPDDPINVPRPYCIVHEASLLESYRRITFMGIEFNVPLQTELYLQREYGDDWLTPKEDHESRTRVYDYLTNVVQGSKP